MFRQIKQNMVAPALRHFATTPLYFKKVCSRDVEVFKRVLGETGVLYDKDPQNLSAYNTDWTRRFNGNSNLVLRPKTTKQVSEVLAYCTKERIAVVPQGGNTGLVGGSVPVSDEVVMSLAHMNKVRHIDLDNDAVVVAEAGCVLDSLDQKLLPFGRMVPVDLAARGSCTVGGMLATNAGGIRVLRYGSMSACARAAEYVLPTGEIIAISPADMLRKNNTGPSLHSLVAGSEGTLAVITAVGVSTVAIPSQQCVAVVTLSSSDSSNLKDFFNLAKEHLGETLSSFETWDAESANIVSREIPASADTSSTTARNNEQALLHDTCKVLVEAQSAGPVEDRMLAFLEAAANAKLISDGTVSQDVAQAKKLWAQRESITEACSIASKKANAVQLKYDLSLPRAHFYAVLDAVRSQLRSHDLLRPECTCHVLGFGHYGDGNIHVNVGACKEHASKVAAALEPFIYEWTAEHGGSVSAEHGIGQAKIKYLHLAKSQAAIEVLLRLKKTFDPVGILNPNKVFDKKKI